ncbi:MAG: non-canonical purine NTP pyrophosphatase, RdgB/HAM1 family [Chloroflexi bacterium]|nr:non-canonical purine NTP pyrophosphatase, RdgB/HAM1 family [Chloroflexota bacterium]MQG05348.1 RdgB/HAM1 family non-canonical purine NTP pyrophosphatase [SAR202 cluster bacterium]|tara:strand:+ start:766 stop:1362 length:597 start_codon:yes stop_codon:yes gene_type:complete
MSIKNLLIATSNPGKFNEISNLFNQINIKTINPQCLKPQLTILEDGNSIEENAIKKSQGYSKQFNTWALADDSGLEIELLSNNPGVNTSDYGGKNLTSKERNCFLLEQLNQFAKPIKARFRCVISLTNKLSESILFHGICPGYISPIPRGENGFGFDPIFIPTFHQQTMAEMTIDEKNTISHRGKAIQKALNYIKTLK